MLVIKAKRNKSPLNFASKIPYLSVYIMRVKGCSRAQTFRRRQASPSFGAERGSVCPNSEGKLLGLVRMGGVLEARKH